MATSANTEKVKMKLNSYAAEVLDKLAQDYYWEKEFLASVEENFS
jgi:hypothetical protein